MEPATGSRGDIAERDPRDQHGTTARESQGIGIAIGGLNVALYVLLPILLVFGIWTLVSIYAIVKWIGSAPDAINPVVLVMGTAGLVTLVAVLFAVGVGLIGRSMNPKKKERNRH